MKRRHRADRLFSGLFFRLLPYQVLLLVINAANGIVDSLFAGNCIGQSAMSAIGFFAPITHFLFAVIIMLVSGSQLLSGEAMGRNKPESVSKYFSTDMILSVAVSLLTTIILVLFAATDTARFMVESAQERKAMNAYIIGQSVGIPPLVLGQQFFSFLSLENKRNLTTAASLMCVGVNTLMDLLLVVAFPMGELGLSLEEMAVNVITHGFSIDKRRHGIVIRVALVGDEVMIRLIDDCKAFDPLTRVEKLGKGDDFSDVGISIVNRISRNIEYQHLLGLNILTMRL